MPGHKTKRSIKKETDLAFQFELETSKNLHENGEELDYFQGDETSITMGEGKSQCFMLMVENLLKGLLTLVTETPSLLVLFKASNREG